MPCLIKISKLYPAISQLAPSKTFFTLLRFFVTVTALPSPLFFFFTFPLVTISNEWAQVVPSSNFQKYKPSNHSSVYSLLTPPPLSDSCPAQRPAGSNGPAQLSSDVRLRDRRPVWLQAHHWAQQQDVDVDFCRHRLLH